jgi:hypothetical protein
MSDLVRRVREDPVTSALVVSNAVALGAALYYWAEPRGGVVSAVSDAVFSAVRSLPGVSGAIDGQVQAEIKKLESELLADVADSERVRVLPARGWSKETVSEAIATAAKRDKAKWSTGKISGSIYHGGDSLSEIIAQAVASFALTNPLHPETFPSARKMDAEIVGAWHGVGAHAQHPKRRRTLRAAMAGFVRSARSHGLGPLPRPSRQLRHDVERRH